MRIHPHLFPALAREHLLDALHQAALAAAVAVARLGNKGVVNHVECGRDNCRLRIRNEAAHHARAEAAALPVTPSASGPAGAALERRRQNRANISRCRRAGHNGRQDAGCGGQNGRIEELLAGLVASSATASASAASVATSLSHFYLTHVVFVGGGTKVDGS